MSDFSSTIAERSVDMLARAELLVAGGVDPVKAATLAAAAHYRDGLVAAQLQVPALLRHMAENAQECAALPVDKISRWLGFCQAEVMQVCDKHRVLGFNISVATERDVTRSLFHWAYRKTGQILPESVDVSNDDAAPVVQP